MSLKILYCGLILKTFIHVKYKKLFNIANKDDPDQTASSDLGLCCSFMPFLQATSVQNFRTSIISQKIKKIEYPKQFLFQNG